MSDEKDFNVGRTLFDDYKVKSVIAKDQIATVYLAKMISTGKLVALKTLNFLKPEVLESFEEVIEKQKLISHEHVVSSLECKKTSAGRIFQVMEYVEGVSLGELIETTGKFESEEEIASMFTQVCGVLEDCHKKNDIHGNISPSNIILLEEDGKVVLKLTDFGMSSVKSVISFDADIPVDQSYSSPELIELMDPTSKSDVYSLGLVLYETICGENANEQRSEDGSPKAVAEFNPKIRCSYALDDLFKRALKEDTKERLESIEKFAIRLNDWIEDVRLEIKEEEETKAKLAQEAQESIEAQEDASLIELKQSVHDIVTLKSKQLSQEETIAMKFSDIASQGPRQSPVKTARRITISIVSSVAIFAALVYSFITFEEPIRKAWKESSTNVSNTVFSSKKDVNQPTENEIAQKNRLKPTEASMSSPLITKQDKVKTRSGNVQPTAKQLSKKNRFYYEPLPAEKLLIKRPYHPPANKNASTFTNNVR